MIKYDKDKIKTSGIKKINVFFASSLEKNSTIKNLVNVLLIDAVTIPIVALCADKLFLLSSPRESVMASTSANPDMNEII
jgi:hypothetical protein